MKTFFVAIFFLPCMTSVKTKVNEAAGKYYKHLDFLESYKSSVDTIGDKVVTKYNKLNLVKETRDKEWLLFLGNKKVFSGDYDKSRYLIEVYDDAYLLISYVAGKSFSSGPDTFERDSVLIMELITGTSNNISLPKTYLTRSSDFLFKAYNCPTDSLKFNKGYRYCAIESIDMTKHLVLLINQCHQTEKFEMLSR